MRTDKKIPSGKIREWLKQNPPYRLYGTTPRCGKTVISQLKQKSLNCSDNAFDDDTIDTLACMGVPRETIQAIIAYALLQKNRKKIDNKNH